MNEKTMKTKNKKQTYSFASFYLFAPLLALFLIASLFSCSLLWKYSGTITNGNLNGYWNVYIDVFPMAFEINIKGDRVYNSERVKIGAINKTGFFWKGPPSGVFVPREIKEIIIEGDYEIKWIDEDGTTKTKNGKYIMKSMKEYDFRKLIEIIGDIWPMVKAIV